MTNEYHGDAQHVVQAARVESFEQHLHFHRAETKPPERPMSIPAEPTLLVDREYEHHTLHRVLERSSAANGSSDSGSGAVLIALCGLSGIGKSTLARSFAWQVHERFEDGFCYTDWHGHPVSGSAELARSCLRKLGTAERELPSTDQDALQLLRDRTRGRRMGFVFDGLVHPRQLLKLRLAAPESMILFTSQHGAAEFSSDGVSSIDLEPLSRDHAIELLTRITDTDLAGTDPDVERLVERCGHTPLALEFVGRKIRRLKHWTPRRAAEWLADPAHGREMLLDNPEVRDTLELAVTDLPAEQAELYRLLGAIPCRTFDTATIAALLDTDSTHAADLLYELHAANLVRESEPERFHLHDLVRLHASEHAGALDPRDTERAHRRLVTRYRRMGAHADRAVMEPSRLRVAGDEHLVASEGNPFTKPAALRWLETEFANILALVHHASRRGDHETVLALCDGALWTLHNHHKHYEETLRAFELAIDAADRRDDRSAGARMRILRTRVLMECHRFAEAHAQALEARETAASTGHRQVLAAAYEFHGRVYLEQERYAPAVGLFRSAWEISERLGKPRGMALVEHFLAQAHSGLGEQEKALEFLETAAARLADFPNDWRTSAKVKLTTGVVRQRMGLHRQAVEQLERAVAELSSHQSDEDDEKLLFELAAPFEYLVPSLRELGEPDRAEKCLREAVAIYERAGSPKAERLRAGTA
ncbi:NB-ARC domain-containing protein [Actinopolyspora mzabensis]|uniref:NB-ARC domain-containing protein n=1 Tax=Actinopolyspora mzabensis TaxID=995066 RepID=A0A1G9CTY5_ACTMZ|nr:NB-ARC domain-containing protein [Actinopolyspora mzabensis]SDK54854.1 NB-ARC domain-containing protein [Actinopolyspora mzabensis]